MRRHAKASPAGSTQHQAKGLGRFFRGADATRGTSPDAEGSGAPAVRRVVLLCALLAAAFCVALGVGSASAMAPAISSTSVSAVTIKTAVLEAEINPGGEATTYHFEYGTADCSSNPCISTPSFSIGSGSSAFEVSKEVLGLSPDTIYHFRVVATNGNGPTQGADTTFVTFAQFVPNVDCPNSAFRYGRGAYLPDCRAYEMVSPVDKNGGDIRGFEGILGTQKGYRRAEMNQASPDGDKVTFSSYKAFAGSESATYSNQYIASRGASGWSTEAISPPRSLVTAPHFEPQFIPDVQFKGFTDDLSQAWFTEISRFPLAPGALGESLPNLYGRDNGDGTLHAVSIGVPQNPQLVFPELSGFTPDGSHVLFSFRGGLTPDAAGEGKQELYDYSNGELQLVSVLPSGEANPDNSAAGAGSEGSWHGNMQVEHTISDDGSRIFWWSTNFIFAAHAGRLYVRIDDATTVPVSVGTKATFWRADSDGTTVIYSEPNPSEAFQDLYEFNVDTETRSLIAGQVRGVAGGSDSLSHLYFVSKESLAPGATAGERNLYLDREGAMTFIATLSATDTGESSGNGNPSIAEWAPGDRNSRVSADGRYIVFMSTRSLTGYDNTDAITGDADFEVYRYDAETDKLICLSCNPSGARPVGHGLPRPYDVKGDTDFSGIELWTAAWLPTWENSFHASRVLSGDGNRVFFNSFDPLVSGDTNGTQDVYQWEATGTGDCTIDAPGYSELNAGCVSLISTGQSSAVSEFIDASPKGDDVFIRTESSIDPRDPGLLDIYDARVGGGYPPPPALPTPCIGDACQGSTAPPDDRTPASAGFRGAGNPQPRRARRNCRAGSRRGKAGDKAKKKRTKRCKRSSRRASR